MRKLWDKRSGKGALILLLASGLVVPGGIRAGQTQALKERLQEASTQRELLAIGQASQKLSTGFSQEVLQALADQQAAKRMAQRAAQAITPEMRVQAFRAAVLLGHARNVDVVEQMRAARKPATVSALSAHQEEGIRGVVTVGGQPPQEPITVVAFDSLGYVVCATETDGAGEYFLSAYAGKFYVMTISNGYVDELYNNVPAPFGDKAGWRAATLVTVPPGAQVSGINFDLDDGAIVTGVIRDSDGIPVAGELVSLVLTSAYSPTTLLSYDVVTDPYTGEYVIHVPAAGEYKLSARTSELGPTWYHDKSDWATADVIRITSTADELRGIDFILAPAGAVVPAYGGAISGQIMGPTFMSPVFIAFAVAFDASDTSVAGIGLSLLGSPYVISGLAPGQYYVWANDLLGDLVRAWFLPTAMNYQGEFYNNARTPAQATLVTVTENDTTEGINFMLDRGATIQGVVKGPNGQALDSVLVIAVDRQIESVLADPFFSHLQLEVSITDQNGAYTLTGLREGDWVLRTLTVLKHAGEVLDEYYQNRYSLWDFENATVLHVNEGATLTGIDFALEAPAYIGGRVTDAPGGDPIEGALIIPIELHRALPEIAFGGSEEDGTYGVGPLPPGDYALLCLIPDKTHLSEFYDGAYRLAEATPIHVPGPGIILGVDFTLERGATVAGYVRFPDGPPVGADSLYGFPVIAFEASTGKLADFAFVQFPGGYRIHNLLPGEYKIAALPILFGYATTYVGGGASYGDPNSAIIGLQNDQVVLADITLAKASGSISGTVRDVVTGEPLNQAVVVAYDASGHIQGLGVAGIDLASFSPTASPGTYQIRGLRPGSYYVRTFALTNAIPLGAELDLGNLPLPGLGDGLPDLTGLNLGGIELPTLYLDLWYPGIPVPEPELADIDLVELVLAMMRHGGADERDADLIPVFLPLPFAAQVPQGAVPVQVGSGETAGVNFSLPPIDLRAVIGVEDNPRAQESTPRTYALHAAYPNPFNAQTRVEWELPASTEVTVQIYNVLGAKVKELVRATQGPGLHAVVWDATDESGKAVPSGVYIVRLEAGKFRAATKLLLQK
ncbi:MAG: T9SS type A sorting domain-containing protein [candidate division KSB1 bacterium]|nr:T9SS type A sorting domain-containing protein [candidate division KSB1 bacterium]